MSLRADFEIPDAAKFVYGEEGNTHIASTFGDTWCSDFYDEETDTYAPTITVVEFAEEPSHPDGLCRFCLAAAKEEQG